MTTPLTRFHRQRGQGMTEYALILGLIAIVVILALTSVGQNVQTAFCHIADDLGASMTCSSGGAFSGTAGTVFGQGGSFTSGTANSGGTSATSLSAPKGVAFDGSSATYLADYSNNRVLSYPSGSTTASAVWGQGSSGSTFSTGANCGATVSATCLTHPGSVVVDATGGVYVADSSDNRVLYFPSGSYTATKEWGQGNSGTLLSSSASCGASVSATCLTNPTDIALDSSGGLYVADTGDNRVVYYASGSYSASKVWGQGSGGSSFTTSASCGASVTATCLSGPTDVVVTTAGTAYIADHGDNRVLYYASGSYSASSVWGQGAAGTAFTTSASCGASVTATCLSGPTDVILDGSGNLYVSDTSDNRVIEYPSGSYTASTSFGQGGSLTTSASCGGSVSATCMTGPTYLGVASANLYVADTGNNRVLVFGA